MTNKEIVMAHPKPYFGCALVLDDISHCMIVRAPQPLEIIAHDIFIRTVKSSILCFEQGAVGPVVFEYNNVKVILEKLAIESDSYKSAITIEFGSVWDYANRMDELGKLIDVDSINEQYTKENVDTYMLTFFRGLFDRPELTIESVEVISSIIVQPDKVNQLMETKYSVLDTLGKYFENTNDLTGPLDSWTEIEDEEFFERKFAMVDYFRYCGNVMHGRDPDTGNVGRLSFFPGYTHNSIIRKCVPIMMFSYISREAIEDDLVTHPSGWRKFYFKQKENG